MESNQGHGSAHAEALSAIATPVRLVKSHTGHRDTHSRNVRLGMTMRNGGARYPVVERMTSLGHGHSWRVELGGTCVRSSAHTLQLPA